MKVCFKCGIKKPLKCFYKHKKMRDGYLNKCKDCTKKDSNNNPKTSSKVKESYDKTEKGVIRVIYKTQKRNSKLRGHNHPEYTKDELKDWLYKNGFKNLYDNWVKSGFNSKLKPSIDRIDDFKGYSFSNIRLGTYQDNRNHQKQDILNGNGTSGKRCKQVLCFDAKGNLIAEYVSYSSAKRAVGYSFERVLNTNRPDRKNKYIWWYKDNYNIFIKKRC